MSQPLTQRLNYHPDPREQILQADRKVSSRLDLITSRVDVDDKVIWDLGCSGGFFSFALSKRAKKVIAIDGDLELIKRNREIQRDLGIKNIEFIHAEINSNLINQIEAPDITLFLAVFHHMLSVSDVYDWNSGVTSESINDLLESINSRTKSLVFEIGYPNEGCVWCNKLPNYGENWDEYVFQNVFKGGYKSIEAVRPRIDIGWLNKKVISKLSSPYRSDSSLISKVKKTFNYDARDLRKIYFGHK